MAQKNRNLSLALSLLCIVLGMIMLAYASVPLYRIFCKTTGFGGVAEQTLVQPSSTNTRVITVRFDANVNPGLYWSFTPAQKDVSVHVGAQNHIEYIAENKGSLPTTGTATFNITPVKAGAYFNKIQCFCFSEQTLAPHAEKRLGVTFFIDPAINDNHDLDDIHTITLSYTFFPVQGK